MPKIEVIKRILERLHNEMGLKDFIHPLVLTQVINQETGIIDSAYEKRLLNSLIRSNVLRWNGKTFTLGAYGYKILGIEPEQEIQHKEDIAEIIHAVIDKKAKEPETIIEIEKSDSDLE